MSLAILCPVYNDWDSFLILLHEISTTLGEAGLSAHIVVIDDASIDPLPHEKLQKAPDAGLGDIKIVRLTHNVGHQQAIALGLAYISKHMSPDQIIVMDGDGEDAPTQLRTLINKQKETGAPIVVAQRGRRYEGAGFQFSYFCFKIIFRLLTGVKIDFGNFSILSKLALRRLVAMPSLLAHYPGTLMRSKLHIEKIELDRGKRYFGQSKMDFLGLLLHAMGAISSFVDRVLIRVSILLSVLLLLGVVIVLMTIGLKFSDLPATPGWATTMIGVQILFISQAMMFAFGGLLFFLKSKQEINHPAPFFLSTMIEKVETITPTTTPSIKGA